MATDDYMTIEVAYATPDKQLIVAVEVPAGATVADAVRLSGIEEHFPEIDLDNDPVGIFSRKVKRDKELKAGDRVEIYRPLQADPKHVRRELAKLGKSMGRGGKGPAGSSG